MHSWGDENVDWDGIQDAADIIGTICRRYGRFSCHTKEKYGTVRAYVGFYISLGGFLYPGYVYNQLPKWLFHLDIHYITPFLELFHKPIFWYQRKVYNYAYQKALKKYPHLREEILCCADYPEYIKGAKVRE